MNLRLQGQVSQEAVSYLAIEMFSLDHHFTSSIRLKTVLTFFLKLFLSFLYIVLHKVWSRRDLLQKVRRHSLSEVTICDK